MQSLMYRPIAVWFPNNTSYGKVVSRAQPKCPNPPHAVRSRAVAQALSGKTSKSLRSSASSDNLADCTRNDRTEGNRGSPAPNRLSDSMKIRTTLTDMDRHELTCRVWPSFGDCLKAPALWSMNALRRGTTKGCCNLPVFF